MLRFLLMIAFAALFASCEKDKLVEEVQPMTSPDLTEIETDQTTENKPPLSEQAIQQLNGQPITDLIRRLHESEQKISSKHFIGNNRTRGGSFHTLVNPLPSRDIRVQSALDRIDFRLGPSVQTGMSSPLQYVVMHRLACWILHQKDIMARMDSPDESLNATDASLLKAHDAQGIPY